ncbi:unnamed protein product [Didymodactylos carnosus]|uniref:Uncharacterized protein n=1 Tax=Didymodactylos carnosus TaxID=1234261 RepID=A0A814LVG7_9BILA|nr:unnamed protein product [Didymodactylos carnosus]CAF1068296.1 unnamed protein product [Didymodactylos carnosus]CAF3772290.1 unnamed protein product [Didymodactylos carnosus]CAF3835698.1 unnamed protein product [Didymodactylos carnosus]
MAILRSSGLRASPNDRVKKIKDYYQSQSNEQFAPADISKSNELNDFENMKISDLNGKKLFLFDSLQPFKRALNFRARLA